MTQSTLDTITYIWTQKPGNQSGFFFFSFLAKIRGVIGYLLDIWALSILVRLHSLAQSLLQFLEAIFIYACNFFY